MVVISLLACLRVCIAHLTLTLRMLAATKSIHATSSKHRSTSSYSEVFLNAMNGLVQVERWTSSYQMFRILKVNMVLNKKKECHASQYLLIFGNLGKKNEIYVF
jgi:hypothetical protein